MTGHTNSVIPDLLYAVHHGTPFRTPLKPLGPSQHYRIEGFQVVPNLSPHYTERCWSLGKLYSSDHLIRVVVLAPKALSVYTKDLYYDIYS